VIREYVWGILPKPPKKLCVCVCLEKGTPPQEEDAPVDCFAKAGKAQKAEKE